MKLPKAIAQYVNGQNAPDVGAILACFSKDAFVHDEGRDYRGEGQIKTWIKATLRKYEFKIDPVGVARSGAETVMAGKLSGSFPGSPVVMNFRFKLARGLVVSLIIEQHA